MSLLGLLATGAGIPIDPPPDIDPDAVRLAIEAQLNPANYGGRVFTVGTDHATITGCLALADAASSNGIWSLVLVPPGTYPERITRQHSFGWTDIASTTLDPDDVVIQAPDDTDDTLEHYGTGGIVAGVTLVGNGRSAVHSGEHSATRLYEFIYYKVKGTQAGSGDALSFGVGPGQGIFAYDCLWQGYGTDGARTRAVYTHNFGEAGLAVALPAVFVFDGCTIDGGTPLGAGSMTIQDLNSGQADLFYIKGGSTPGQAIGYRLWDATEPSYTGAVDPTLNYFTNETNSLITRVLPAELPTPARLAAWLD